MFLKRLRAAAWWTPWAAGVLLLAVLFTPLTTWWTLWLAGPWPEAAGEVMFIPGGDIQNDGQIGMITYQRCVHAVRYWRRGGYRQIVVAGGPDRLSAPTPISVTMRDFLVSQGVPAVAILVEDKSRSTRENVRFAKPLLDGLPGRKVVLSSDAHMRRLMAVCRKEGLQASPAPVPDVLKHCSHWWSRPTAFALNLSETGKLVYYSWQGWI